MGYCMHQRASSFRIKKENLEPAYKKVKQEMSNDSYHWQERGWLKRCRDLYAVFEEWLYSPTLDEESGDIVKLQFFSEKLGDEFTLFKVVAPYVEAGSFLEMVGEDGTKWRWIFDGKTCKQVYAKEVWDE